MPNCFIAKKKIVFPYTEYPVLKLLQEFQLFSTKKKNEEKKTFYS